jgi:hypothetical protein
MLGGKLTSSRGSGVLGEAKDSQRRISALCKQHDKRRVAHPSAFFALGWERRTPQQTDPIVLPNRTLSSRAKKDRPRADDLAQSRDPASADAQQEIRREPCARYSSNKGGPPLDSITRRHPEAAESLAMPRTPNEGSLHSASTTGNEGCPIPGALFVPAPGRSWHRKTAHPPRSGAPGWKN